MSDIIAGADGCQAGWVVVRENLRHASLSWEVVRHLPHLFGHRDEPEILAVDIPIGLPMVGSGACDLEARRLLGPRRSSVFPAPIRPMLAATSYTAACGARYEAEGKRVSKQLWAIVPKIREVDDFLRSELPGHACVREVHPEVCFYFMAGRRPMTAGKRVEAGQTERIGLLRTQFGENVDSALGNVRNLGCQADDVIDAFAAHWTARRIHAGTAVTLPATPPRDSFGLPMEMVA